MQTAEGTLQKIFLKFLGGEVEPINSGFSSYSAGGTRCFLLGVSAIKFLSGIVFLCGLMMISGGSFGSASSAMPMVDENTDLAYFCRSPNTPVGNACIARVCLFGGICGTYWDGQRAYCDCQ